MATGVKIQSAKYGVGTTTVDVTKAVSVQLKDGRLNFVVTPAALNVNDPAPGRLKTLTVTYSINNGASNTATAVDGESMDISAPPARLASGLQIKKARYGFDRNFTDVTSAVRTYLNEGSINVTVSASAMGIPDPNPQKVKYLMVDYTINDEPGSKKIQDGQKFQINAPAVAADVTTTPTEGALDIVGMLFNDVFLFIKTYFVLAMTIQGAKYGQTLFSGGYWIIGGLTLFSYGFFPILVLPVLLFIWHVIMG
jgi:hypothetical protein